MKAYFKVYDVASGLVVNTMTKDVNEFYAWLERAFERKANIFCTDFNHIKVDTVKRFFDIEIR